MGISLKRVILTTLDTCTEVKARKMTTNLGAAPKSSTFRILDKESIMDVLSRLLENQCFEIC
jgi:hypothetical protein